MTTTSLLKTEHGQTWHGMQRCRRCNMLGIAPGNYESFEPCFDCNSRGWTLDVCFAHDPWNEVAPGLWVGGHDYNATPYGPGPEREASAVPTDADFDAVVSMYRRCGYEPQGAVEHYEALFYDSNLDIEAIEKATAAADWATDRLVPGGPGPRALPGRSEPLLARRRPGPEEPRTHGAAGGRHDPCKARSPWALCNDDFVRFLTRE
jgi:hypothetical protein